MAQKNEKLLPFTAHAELGVDECSSGIVGILHLSVLDLPNLRFSFTKYTAESKCCVFLGVEMLKFHGFHGF